MPIQQLAGEMRQLGALPSPHHPAPPAQYLLLSLLATTASKPCNHFLLSGLLCPQPPAPNQRELRNRLLAQEQLLSKRFLIVCIERELGTALAPVMEPSSSCPGWPNPPSPPFTDPWPWRLRFFRTYRLYPLFSVMSSLVPPRRKEGKREPYLSYARNLFLQLPHARRYVNAPSAPTTAPERPGGPGAWHSSVPGDREARGGRGASGPAEAGKGKGN